MSTQPEIAIFAKNAAKLNPTESAKTPHSDRVGTKKKIRLACLQILENPNATPKDKIWAARILHAEENRRRLARNRNRKKRLTKKVTVTKSVMLGDIFRQVAKNASDNKSLC